MFKRTIMSAALTATLGLGSAFAGAQTVSDEEIDMTTGNAPGTAQQGGSDKNELKDPGAATSQHNDPSAQRSEAAHQGEGGDRPDQSGTQQSGKAPPQQAGETAPPKDSSTQQETTGQGQGVKDSGGTAGVKAPAEGANAPSTPDTASSQEGTTEHEDTTGQGQGVKDSGGTADVKTPGESADTPADHDRPGVVSREGTDGNDKNP